MDLWQNPVRSGCNSGRTPIYLKASLSLLLHPLGDKNGNGHPPYFRGMEIPATAVCVKWAYVAVYQCTFQVSNFFQYWMITHGKKGILLSSFPACFGKSANCTTQLRSGMAEQEWQDGSDRVNMVSASYPQTIESCSLAHASNSVTDY